MAVLTLMLIVSALLSKIEERLPVESNCHPDITTGPGYLHIAHINLPSSEAEQGCQVYSATIFAQFRVEKQGKYTQTCYIMVHQECRKHEQYTYCLAFP